MFEKSPICALHEYCQSVLRVQSTFKQVPIKDGRQLFHYSIVVNDVAYPTGSGISKKLARSEAGKFSVDFLISVFWFLSGFSGVVG